MVFLLMRTPSLKDTNYIKASALSPDFCGDYSISNKATVLEHQYVNWGHTLYTQCLLNRV